MMTLKLIRPSKRKVSKDEFTRVDAAVGGEDGEEGEDKGEDKGTDDISLQKVRAQHHHSAKTGHFVVDVEEVEEGEEGEEEEEDEAEVGEEEGKVEDIVVVVNNNLDDVFVHFCVCTF
mmetsp:Transcript_949/g.1334  ORF Transcript_949/g.1334 Transcript_949/m.1334 type:complete len:118 (+) Transcript_949:784-1137(+)